MRTTISELAHLLADKLTDSVDRSVIEDFFYQYHKELYEQESEEQLRDAAIDLGIIGEDEELELTDGI
jgi:hypothetical protein